MCLSITYKSPINYTGNKFRLLEQFKQYFPKQTKRCIDLFTGGATVAINIDSAETIAIDKNDRIINLLVFLKKQNFAELILQIDLMLERFGLSNSYKNTYAYYHKYVEGNNGLKGYNNQGYLKLREEYNSLADKTTQKANLFLYVLMVYAFNNDIRFNSRGEFNLPCGKTDMNKQNRKKLEAYISSCNTKNIKFIQGDFSKLPSDIFDGIDFVYVDPPYLITDAVYNENLGWRRNDEESLLNLLDTLNGKGIRFALSNVLEKKNLGVKNDLLNAWLNKNKENYYIHEIDYHYRSASYNKKNRDGEEQEVLITNYEVGS